jgi:hypothetical protein
MIQRIQTLFLLQLAFLGISLFFIPVQFLLSGTTAVNVQLLPFAGSTGGHIAAVAINGFGVLLSIITIFLFKKRELQVKLCYILIVLYLIIISMFAFCPLVAKPEAAEIKTSAFAYIVCTVCIISAFLAARFVKKDIELLKSTDRIR